MRKAERQGRILSIIAQNATETQEDLVRSLNGQGAKATQSTVSRDIKELKLGKRPTSDGRRVYALPEPSDSLPEAASRAAVFAEGYLRSDYSGNIVVVRTRTGMANACAVAVDGLRLREIVGTLAGDDTILVVTRSEEASLSLMGRLDDMARSSPPAAPQRADAAGAARAVDAAGAARGADATSAAGSAGTGAARGVDAAITARGVDAPNAALGGPHGKD